MATLFSLDFLFSFLVFFLIYWSVSAWPQLQNMMLLLAGYTFVYFISSDALLILISWSGFVCLLIAMAESESGRKYIGLALSIVMSGYFIVFKYYVPIQDWLQAYLSSHDISLSLPEVTILLPLGLSFYLFNSVSLVLSVSRGEIESPGILNTLLYINFIPTLIAGPVNRAADLLPQFSATKRHLIEYKKALYLITLALIKLFLLSSWLNDEIVSSFFSLPEGKNGWDAIIAVYAWAWNIYFNFSGYTNLVTGIALLLGFRIGRNFSHPYQAASLREFWRDWHISLSNFIRDYVYFPLGGNRKGNVRTQLNVMAAMILSGIWHGAGMTFLIWGALHGLGMVVFHWWRNWVAGPLRIALPSVVARLLTFNFVCFAWIFFRATSLHDALVILGSISHVSLDSLTASRFWIIAAFTGAVVMYPELVKLRHAAAQQLLNLKWYALPAVIIPVLALGFFFAPSGVPGFIYAAF